MTDKKARRRIKRFIKTGEPQARVHRTGDDDIFEYKVKHHQLSWLYKRDRIGRLRLIK